MKYRNCANLSLLSGAGATAMVVSGGRVRQQGGDVASELRPDRLVRRAVAQVAELERVGGQVVELARPGDVLHVLVAVGDDPPVEGHDASDCLVVRAVVQHDGAVPSQAWISAPSLTDDADPSSTGTSDRPSTLHGMPARSAIVGARSMFCTSACDVVPPRAAVRGG